VKRITIKGNEAVIEYTLPVPPNNQTTDTVSVLPIVPAGGAEGVRTPYLFNAIEALSQSELQPHNAQDYTTRIRVALPLV
jgi:hypothetical protein